MIRLFTSMIVIISVLSGCAHPKRTPEEMAAEKERVRNNLLYPFKQARYNNIPAAETAPSPTIRETKTEPEKKYAPSEKAKKKKRSSIQGKKKAVQPDKPLTVKDLQQKIVAITNLSNKLKRKKEEVIATRREYYDDIAKYKKEIQREREKSGSINSYADAIRNKRIYSNLSLIQRQLAYAEKLSELEFRLDMGSEELLYLEREARADLEIVKVLEKKDQLIGRINKALTAYQPYAENFVISKSQLKLKSPEAIWNDIISGKL